MECGKKCEVYSRIVGYFRPIANWNVGKKEEFKDRLEYDAQKALLNEFAKDSASESIASTDVEIAKIG